MMARVKHAESETMNTLVIEHLKASDLPSEWARRLQARPDQTVTVRIATEASGSAEEATAFTTDDPAFGIWQDYDETTDVEAFARRLRALIQALGTVEAEQFVAALTRDRFDYTEWRKTGLPDLDLETLSAQAAQYSRILDN